MISHGFFIIPPEIVMQGITELNLVSYYLNLRTIPQTIKSPLRRDIHPSFRIYSPDGKKVRYKDFSTGDSGGIFDLLEKIYNLSYRETLNKIYNDKKYMINKSVVNSIENYSAPATVKSSGDCIIRSKRRDWKQYDFDYWQSYGISKNWILHADVYPISLIFIKYKYNVQCILADKYAYTFIENKDGNTTEKIYQPFNKKGFKWRSSHDSSVWDLWTKLPEKGNNLIITSSRKDAMCLWANTGIPSVSPQSEACNLKESVINELKSRFNHIFVLYDNDFQNKQNNGRIDGEQICKKYELKQIEIPSLYKSKDISDLYKNHGHEIVKRIIEDLINN